jgi:hypothetical protein
MAADGEYIFVFAPFAVPKFVQPVVDVPVGAATIPERENHWYLNEPDPEAPFTVIRLGIPLTQKD